MKQLTLLIVLCILNDGFLYKTSWVVFLEDDFTNIGKNETVTKKEANQKKGT